MRRSVLYLSTDVRKGRRRVRVSAVERQVAGLFTTLCCPSPRQPGRQHCSGKSRSGAVAFRPLPRVKQSSATSSALRPRDANHGIAGIVTNRLQRGLLGCVASIVLLIGNLGLSAAADLRAQAVAWLKRPLFASHIQAEVERLNVRDGKARSAPTW